MTQSLNKDNVNDIIKSAFRQHLSYMRTQMDGIKIEIKVVREEVKKVSWEMEQVKERLISLEE